MIQTILKSNNNALVVLSGGQDSMTCLFYALATREPGAKVHAVAFNYGQKHVIELESARRVCELFDVPFQVIEFDFLKSLTSALTDSSMDVSANHPRLGELPASFVPNRNALFLTMAHGLAAELKCQEVWTGVCQTDYSGYPDCRAEFIWQLNLALSTGYQASIAFVTPLMNATKAETFALADALGHLETIVDFSHTCYNGDHETFHNWGFGCGECPACKLREKGWNEFKAGVFEPFSMG